MSETTERRPLFERGQAPARWIVIMAISVSVISLISGWIGDALLAELVDREPIWVVILNPRNRNLVLVTNQLDAATFYIVAFVRLVFSDPVNYLLGFWFGDRMIAWIERRSRTYGPMVKDGEQLFRRFSYPLIFAAPNNIVCMLAGATGVRAPIFFFLNITGTIARLVAVRAFGAQFESPIQGVLDFIGEYRPWILGISVIAVLWTIFGEFRGDNGDVAALRELAKEDGSGSPDGAATPSDARVEPSPDD